MPVTINSYIESLFNASERFRTLCDVWPVTDMIGQPVFSSGDGYVRFAVVRNGADYSMICFLCDIDNPYTAQTGRIMNIANKRNPHIAPCEYRRNEITVFDYLGNAVRRDIILCTRPAGLPLGHYVRSILFSSDRKPFRSLLKGFAAMAHSLNRDEITHGNLKPENIIVAPDGNPIAIDFAMVREPSERCDRLALSVSALAIYLTGCEPDLYPLMGGKKVFGICNCENTCNKANGILPYLRHIKAQFEFSGIGAALDVVAIIESFVSGGEGTSYGDICKALDRLAATPFADLSLLADILRTLSEPDYVSAPGSGKTIRYAFAPMEEDTTLLLDFADCDYVGTISDTLMRFRKGKHWGYCDSYGRLLGKAEYLSAEDFYEGRARVETDGGYGLIDRSGEWVMRPEFDQLEWYGPENVVSACRDGIWGIYSRLGDCLTSERYDWLCGPGEGFFVAGKGGKYCYLKLSGEPLTDCRFDEAFSFCGGRALVSIGSESFHIDRDGRRISSL